MKHLMKKNKRLRSDINKIIIISLIIGIGIVCLVSILAFIDNI